MHNSTSSSYSKKKLKDDSSDEYSNYESYELPANFVPRHSERNFNKSISYQELNPELEELLEEEEYSEQYYENDKIDHIYLSRKSNNGLEYLVTFQHQEGIFAQWIVDFMANEVSNFARLLKKFNETESKFKFYDTSTREFSISYDSPIHVISNRKCPYAPNLQEFLLEYTLDQGTVFSWEKETDDIPRNLVEHYLSTKVSIDPIVHTTRPDSLVITPEEAEEYKSRDNCIPRDYQIVGINWLLKCFCSNHGCILADEMGLGKTIECLMFLKYLDLHTSYHGPHIIAVRTNTYRQWRSEIERWTDFKYVPYYGAPEQRSTYRTYSFPSINESGEIEPNKFGFNILLISYDIFLKDYTEFRNIPWQIICVDEGHRIKNDNGKKHKAFTNIPYQHRIILTGTPIQSTLKELWNLLHFVSPNYFLGDSTFPEDDVESLEPDELDELKKLIAPHLMRRSLLEVEKSIIPKDEKIAFLQLTKTQKELTRLTLMHELYRLSNDCNLNESNMLHRICNHPFLVKGAEQYYTGKYKISRLQLLINCSSKLIFLDKILPIFRKEQRSVLIFSQRLKILKILDEYCQLKKYPHEILTGNMNDNEKDVAIKKFLDPTKDVFIFLISTRSGSEGLNLTKASITIIFDPDWNPQNDLQALGRCHRIGQTQKVDVLRLITYGTYEHEMFARAQRKMKLWKTLLGNGVITDPSLAQIVKSEENPKNVQQQNSLLLNPAIQNEMSALDNITLYQINVSDDIQIPKESNIKEPPPIDQYKTKKNHSFEDVLENMATIIDISELEESNSRFIPKVDCSLGLDNEQFLEMFPFDPSTISSVTKKKNKKERVQKVQFDAKVAKRIIQFLELHGYGEWEAIHASIHYICPIEQLQKFCQVATILHFRAIDWTKVVCFPFLLLQLKKDISSFDLSYVMCNDDSDWYSIFSKRSSLNGEGYSCKLISNHIHKTALTFLSNLEHHLIINEWRKDDEHIQFPFENLPPSIEQLQHHTDHELYDMLISNQQINTDVNRIGNIFSVIKGQLLMRTIPVERMIIDFWTKSEILTLLSVLRNFGSNLLLLPIKQLHSKVNIMSKTPEMVAYMLQYLINTFRQMINHQNQSTYIIPEEVTNVSVAPIGFQENIEIDNEEIKITIKRLLILALIKKAIKYLPTLENILDNIVPKGKNWWTNRHSIELFDNIMKYGIDYLSIILLSPKNSFVNHLNEDDIKYLETLDQTYLKINSNIPEFLHDESQFFYFLKELTVNAPRIPHVVTNYVNPFRKEIGYIQQQQFEVRQQQKILFDAFKKLHENHKSKTSNPIVLEMSTFDYIQHLKKTMKPEQFKALQIHLLKQEVESLQKKNEEGNKEPFENMKFVPQNVKIIGNK